MDDETFQAAQRIIGERAKHYSDEELLDLLRGLLERHRYLSGIIIDELELGPSSSAFRAIRWCLFASPLDPVGPPICIRNAHPFGRY